MYQSKPFFFRSRISLLSALFAAALLASPVHADQETSAVSEARTQGQLWATYALNRHLNPFDLDVTVEGDTVTLSGDVDDAVKKDLAEQIALATDGVENVNNRISVKEDYQPTEASDDAGRTFGDRVSDATTAATVKSKLLWNRHTSGMSINVDSRDGVVTLEGEVASDAARETAERLAANTDGVRSVNNDIRVNANARSSGSTDNAEDRDAGDAFSDAWITTKVKSTLLFSTEVSGTSIGVETRDGTVHLEGQVESEEERTRAIQLAREIKGVKRVDAANVSIGN
jgi:osmotically-inducible protein OsmY